MFIFTACVWIGMVMMNMMSKTSITSISGVVLMSIITSPSSLSLPAPTFIAMSFSLLQPLAGTGRRLGDETHLEDACALAVHHQATHRFVTHFRVAADVHLGLRLFHGFDL